MRGNIRGNAMLELIFCLLPYMMVFLGASFFWHLMLGKQEVIKFKTASAMPGNDELGEQYFFGSLRSGATTAPLREFLFSSGADEAVFNDMAKVDDADEPVLPYSSDGGDLKRALEFGGNTVWFDRNAGGYRVGRRKTARRLEALGFLGQIDRSRVYTSTEDIPVDVLQLDLLAEASRAMGEWIDYRAGTANYRFAIPFGHSKMPMERGDPANYSWRSVEGRSIFRRDVFAFWPVIARPDMRESSSFANLSANLNTVFSVAPASLSSSASLGAISTTLIDKAGFPHN